MFKGIIALFLSFTIFVIAKFNYTSSKTKFARKYQVTNLIILWVSISLVIFSIIALIAEILGKYA